MSGSKDAIPRRDALLLSWGNNFASQLATLGMAVGISSSQSSAFAAANTAWSDSYAVVMEPSTKTKTTVSAKDAKRAAMKALARDLARVVNAFPATTNTQRIALGLTPRGGTMSPINPPTVPPVMEIISTMGRTIKDRKSVV